MRFHKIVDKNGFELKVEAKKFFIIDGSLVFIDNENDPIFVLASGEWRFAYRKTDEEENSDKEVQDRNLSYLICKNKLCDYEINDEFLYPLVLDQPVGVCPKCGFKTLYLDREFDNLHNYRHVER